MRGARSTIACDAEAYACASRSTLGAVLDSRVYRAALAPALLALFVAAFSLADRPRRSRRTLAPDAFDGGRARARELQASSARAATRDRAPGSAGDEALAGRVADTLRAAASGSTRAARRRADRPTASGGWRPSSRVRPGLAEPPHRRRRAPRRARRAGARPSCRARRRCSSWRASFGPRDAAPRTLMLVSTTGGSAGGAGARACAARAGGPGRRACSCSATWPARSVAQAVVVPWSNGARAAPLRLRRTVEAAVRREAATQPGGPRALGQWARRALPLTVSEQGAVGARGLPAVLLRSPASAARGRARAGPRERLRGLRPRGAARGHGARRAPAPRDAPAVRRRAGGIVTMRKVLPDWAVRLLVGALLLPALLAARRRASPRAPPARSGRAAGCAGWRGAARAVPGRRGCGCGCSGVTGLHRRAARAGPPAALPARAAARRGARAVAVALVLRRWPGRCARGPLRAAGPRGAAPSAGGRRARGRGAACALVGLAALVWVVNPFAARCSSPRRTCGCSRAGPAWRRGPARASARRRRRSRCPRWSSSPRAWRSASARSSSPVVLRCCSPAGGHAALGAAARAGLLAARSRAGRACCVARAAAIAPARTTRRRSATRGPVDATPGPARSAAPSPRCGDEASAVAGPSAGVRSSRALSTRADRRRRAAARRRRGHARCGRSRCRRSTRRVPAGRARRTSSADARAAPSRRPVDGARRSTTLPRRATRQLAFAAARRSTGAPTTATPSGACGSRASALDSVVVEGTDAARPAQGPGPLSRARRCPGARGTVGDRRAPHDLRRAVPQASTSCDRGDAIDGDDALRALHATRSSARGSSTADGDLGHCAASATTGSSCPPAIRSTRRAQRIVVFARLSVRAASPRRPASARQAAGLDDPMTSEDGQPHCDARRSDTP